MLTYLCLIGFSILGQLDELLGEHAAAISKDVAFQFDIRVGFYEFQHNGVTGGIDPDLHVLSSHCKSKKKKKQNSFEYHFEE